MKNSDGNVIHLNTSGVLFLIVTLAVEQWIKGARF